MASNNRDDLIKAFLSSSRRRRKPSAKGFKYQPAKQGALPPMEGGFKAQSSTPRVKRGRYRPAKRNQGIARY